MLAHSIVGIGGFVLFGGLKLFRRHDGDAGSVEPDVDLSALSTVGALFLAAAPPGTNTRALFNALLAWGLSMSVVGAALCWILFG